MPEVPATGRMNHRVPPRPLDYAAAAGTIAVTALVCLGLRTRLTTIDVVMLFLLAVVIVASRHARGPAVFASVLSIACFDFLFVPPYYTFAVHDTAYVLTFAMMFVVALVMSGLTARIREQAGVAMARERRMAALYGMNRDLAGATTPEAIASIVATHVGRAAGGDAEVVLDADASEVEVWDGQGIVLTLQSPLKRFGLVSVRGPDVAHPMPDDEHYVLELLANQAGLALERLALAERNEQSRIEIEAERLRTALLSSLSHDLRTPLGTIEGAGTALAEDAATLSVDSRRDLAETIVEEVRRMARLVSNLLDMMRLETGTLAVHRSWQPLEESLGVALLRLDERLKSHPVEIRLPPDLPLVSVDEVLLEQVFLNLLDNAAKYTPPATPLSVTARLENFEVVVEVADRGPGIPAGEEAAVFRKFHRAPLGEGHAVPAGSGLGLTICEGIIKAHGGRIWVEQRAGGGAAFRFTLPLDVAPPPVLAADAPSNEAGR
jgi:two-component system sensor histidine kinase KdpD